MKDYKTLLFLLFCAIIITGKIYSQDTIYLENPSFEGTPGHNRVPSGWFNCGFEDESPPDIQPSFIFQVTKKALHGNTYLGMVVRDNDTWEAIGSELSHPLIKGHCYQFQIALAQSERYTSVSRKLNEPATYTTPIRLRIWGGTNLCNRTELLAESELIEDLDWQKYSFHIRPTLSDIQFIILEVFYNSLTTNPYNGNLLIDDASSFVLSSICDTTHLHGQLIQPQHLKTTNRITDISIRTSNGLRLQFELPRNLSPKSIDKDKTCSLINAFNHKNIEEVLFDIADYSRHFNTKRWRWTISIKGKGHKKLVRSLNRQIKDLGLRRFVKAVSFYKLENDAVLLCKQSITDGEIGVYY